MSRRRAVLALSKAGLVIVLAALSGSAAYAKTQESTGSTRSDAGGVA